MCRDFGYCSPIVCNCPTHSSGARSEARDAFAHRHIGPSADEQTAMLGTLGYTSRAALIERIGKDKQLASSPVIAE